MVCGCYYANIRKPPDLITIPTNESQKRKSMALEPLIPEDPLAFIQRCVRLQKIMWTYHVNMRMKGRFISRQVILNSVEDYEIIEGYPKDKYLPSYLVYSRYRDRIFHVLFAVDIEEDNVRIVTAYYPDPGEWKDDFKTRR